MADHGTNGDEHRETVRAMFQRYAARLEEIPALVASIKALTNELGRLAERVDKQYTAVEAKLEKDRESRKTNWPTIFGAIGVSFTFLTLGFATWQRASDAENRAARDLLALEQQHQKDLQLTRWDWQKEVNTLTQEVRRREIERYDKVIGGLTDKTGGIDSTLATIKTTLAAVEKRSDDLEGKMRGLTSFIDTKLEAMREAVDAMRGDVIRVGGGKID